MTTTAIDRIAKRADVFAQYREALAEHVGALNAGIAALKRDNLPSIKRALNKAAEVEATLRELVADNPQCFEKPRTRIFSGVKVGYVKGRGLLELGDAEALVARIKKHLPDQVGTLIRVRETPVKEALAQLSAVELKKLGVSVVDAVDQVVVKPVDGEVDKLVTALLEGAADEAASAQAGC